MIRFVPYSPEDLARVDRQPAQARWRDKLLTHEYARSVDVPGMAWTALDEGGRVLGCAGMAPQWEGRVIAWALFGQSIPKAAWPKIAKKIRNEFHSKLSGHGSHRVEITVPKDFGPGCRFAFLLGFEVEGLMKHYGPDGSDHYLFSQVIPCV